jgi:hypothetical protein
MTDRKVNKLSRSKSQIGKSVVLLAIAENFVINPLLGYDYFVKHYIEDGHCACAPERKTCPCPEAINEVKEHGKCKCGLYFKSLNCWLAWDPANPDKNIMQEENSGHNNPDS